MRAGKNLASEVGITGSGGIAAGHRAADFADEVGVEVSILASRCVFDQTVKPAIPVNVGHLPIVGHHL